MIICPVKRFTPELIRIYEKSMLKRLVYGPFGDLRRLEKNRILRRVCGCLSAGYSVIVRRRGLIRLLISLMF
jgi:hypothetical protein